MLTPSYLLHATEPAEEIAEKLHTDILNRIIQRLLLRLAGGDDYTLTAVDKWQIETLQEASPAPLTVTHPFPIWRIYYDSNTKAMPAGIHGLPTSRCY